MASINIDWMEEFKTNFEKWENVTQRVLREILEDSEHEQFKEVAERLEVLGEDGNLVNYYEESINSYDPMMNYGHILEIEPKDEDVLRVALNTNCSVMYNTETDEYFIVLCGGGMDLSQDIGLAYVWLQKWIPQDFITRICKQEGLSISKENFKILKAAIIEQAEHYKMRFESLKTEWENIK